MCVSIGSLSRWRIMTDNSIDMCCAAVSAELDALSHRVESYLRRLQRATSTNCSKKLYRGSFGLKNISATCEEAYSSCPRIGSEGGASVRPPPHQQPDATPSVPNGSEPRGHPSRVRRD